MPSNFPAASRCSQGTPDLHRASGCNQDQRISSIRSVNSYIRFETPPEVHNLVGQKFTFIVRFSTKRSIENPLPSFEVIRTTQQHGKPFDDKSAIKTTRKPSIPIKSKEIRNENTPKGFIVDDIEVEPMDIEKQDSRYHPCEAGKNTRDKRSDDTKHIYLGVKRPFTTMKI